MEKEIAITQFTSPYCETLKSHASEFNRHVVSVWVWHFRVWDTPTGPTIVVSAASWFVMSQVFNSVRK